MVKAWAVQKLFELHGKQRKRSFWHDGKKLMTNVACEASCQNSLSLASVLEPGLHRWWYGPGYHTARRGLKGLSGNKAGVKVGYEARPGVRQRECSISRREQGESLRTSMSCGPEHGALRFRPCLFIGSWDVLWLTASLLQDLSLFAQNANGQRIPTNRQTHEGKEWK